MILAESRESPDRRTQHLRYNFFTISVENSTGTARGALRLRDAESETWVLVMVLVPWVVALPPARRAPRAPRGVSNVGIREQIADRNSTSSCVYL